MDSFQIGAVIAVFALMIVAILVLPIAYRHDRRMARRRGLQRRDLRRRRRRRLQRRRELLSRWTVLR